MLHVYLGYISCFRFAHYQAYGFVAHPLLASWNPSIERDKKWPCRPHADLVMMADGAFSTRCQRLLPSVKAWCPSFVILRRHKQLSLMGGLLSREALILLKPHTGISFDHVAVNRLLLLCFVLWFHLMDWYPAAAHDVTLTIHEHLSRTLVLQNLTRGEMATAQWDPGVLDKLMRATLLAMVPGCYVQSGSFSWLVILTCPQRTPAVLMHIVAGLWGCYDIQVWLSESVIPARKWSPSGQ